MKKCCQKVGVGGGGGGRAADGRGEGGFKPSVHYDCLQFILNLKNSGHLMLHLDPQRRISDVRISNS